MIWVDLVHTAHVLGGCILIGTGSGIAFFMLMAHRSNDPYFVAQTASVVVIADMIFTATAAILQPISGFLLMQHLGWGLEDRWLMISLGLYVVIGMFWLPVLGIQTRMRDEARACLQTKTKLSPTYHRLYRIWFACGIPAFAAILVLLWLMVTRPAF